MSSKSIRWGALAGTAFFLAAFFGEQLAQAGLIDGTDDASALADLHHRATFGNQVGYVLAILGFICLFLFVGALYRVLRQAENPDGWLPDVALIAGTVMIAVKLGSATFAIAARYHPATISASIAGIFDNLGNAAFIISGLFAAIFVLTASLSALGSRTLPRWLAWAGTVVGIAGLITPPLAFHHPTSYIPVPWLLAMLWMAVVGVVLFRRLKPVALDDYAGTTVATPVRASA
jgi:Domain of unknown function (DUF4386)